MQATGGCLCGALRYRFDTEAVIAASNCHCTDCQRCTGGGLATIIILPSEALAFEGEPKFYTVEGTAGSHVSRGFCGHCGSPVISAVDEDPSTKFIKAGSLDDSSWVTVSATYWTDSAQPWAPVNAETRCFAANPVF